MSLGLKQKKAKKLESFFQINPKRCKMEETV